MEAASTKSHCGNFPARRVYAFVGSYHSIINMAPRGCGVGNGAWHDRNWTTVFSAVARAVGKRPLDAAWPTAALIVAAVSHPTHRLALCHGHAPLMGFACAQLIRRGREPVL